MLPPVLKIARVILIYLLSSKNELRPLLKAHFKESNALAGSVGKRKMKLPDLLLAAFNRPNSH